MPKGECIYIRQILSAHVLTTFVGLQGCKNLAARLSEPRNFHMGVAFNYSILFTFVMNESMKPCVSENCCGSNRKHIIQVQIIYFLRVTILSSSHVK